MRWLAFPSRARLELARRFAASGCSDPPTATLTITTGDETDALLASARPDHAHRRGARPRRQGPGARAHVAAYDDSRSATRGAPTSAPSGSGRSTQRATCCSRARRLYVQFGALENTPLEVFVQRTGELARLPRERGSARRAAARHHRGPLRRGGERNGPLALRSLRPHALARRRPCRRDGPPVDVLTEATIAEHYGAATDVVDIGGRIAVIPRRPG